jgi:ADP-ribose pyrophosphatase YjhB (NUDIX family)
LICPAAEHGAWKLPGDQRQADESPPQALQRILSQLPGVESAIGEALTPFSLEHADAQITVHPFLCRCTTEPSPPDSDICKWIGPEELPDYAFEAESEPLIPWLEEHLGTAGEELQRQIELDALRIHQVAKARQATMRAGSYCLITSLACFVAAIDLIWRAARRYILEQAVLRPALYLLAVIPLAWFAWRFWTKAADLRHEAQRRTLPDPASPADFTTLSDGSHVVRNLERMQ